MIMKLAIASDCMRERYLDIGMYVPRYCEYLYCVERHDSFMNSVYTIKVLIFSKINILRNNFKASNYCNNVLMKKHKPFNYRASKT